MKDRPVVIVSNRGPTSFSEHGGLVTPGPPTGGLARGLRPVVAATGGSWVACAVSDTDRHAAALVHPDPDLDLHLVTPELGSYQNFYDRISNETLWFLHHKLWDLPREPSFDRAWREAWDDYRKLNLEVATVVSDIAPPNSMVLVQDYHFALLASHLAARRTDVTTAHFSHTPFAGPGSMSVLPPDVATELLTSMAVHDACGFHTLGWKQQFISSCEAFGISPPNTFISPLPPDLAGVRDIASSPACSQQVLALDTRIGERQLILTVGRLDLSKNLERALLAYRALLHSRPDLHDEVIFAAFVYPTRPGVDRYRQYEEASRATAKAINEEFGNPNWAPVWLDTEDDLVRSMAGLRRYDVLIVNPIQDGLNLVAFEGPAVNEHDGVLVLSTGAGAVDQLGDHALTVHPYDIEDTARQLEVALNMSASERHERAARLLQAGEATNIDQWLADHQAAITSKGS